MRRIRALAPVLFVIIATANCTTTVGFFCDHVHDCEGTTHEECEVSKRTLLEQAPNHCPGLLDSVMSCWSTNSTCQNKKLYLIDGKCTRELEAAQKESCPQLIQ